MMGFAYFPLLTLAADSTNGDWKGIAGTVLAAIGGGLLTFIATLITNKRDNRSEIEKTYAENAKELMDSMNTRLTHVEEQLKEKEEEIERKNQLISDLKEKAENLAKELEKLMSQNEILIQQNKELGDKNVELMEQNRILIERLKELNNTDGSNENN